MKALKFIWALWKRVGETIFKVLAFIALIFLFYAIMFPLSLVMRLFGKRPISTKFRLDQKSYFMPSQALSAEHMRQVF